jgi:hypothetical protein
MIRELEYNTFVFACLVMGFAAWNRSHPWPVYVYLLAFASIQLVEYFLWTHLNDPRVNRAASQAGLVLVLAIPALAIVALARRGAMAGLAAAYIAFLALFLWARPWSATDFSSRPAANGHLRWNWLARAPLWLVLPWAALLLAPLLLSRYYAGAALAAATLAVTLALYYRSGTWGSMWCWVSNTVWFAIAFRVIYGSMPSRCL